MCVRQLVFWLLVVSSFFNYFKMHAWSTSMLLLLHSTFMFSVVKMLLIGDFGGCVLNSHRNYIIDHGKSWNNHGVVILNFCGNPATKIFPYQFSTEKATFLDTDISRNSTTIVPTRSDSYVILCLQFLCKTLTFSLHLSCRESIDNLCINPILWIGLIHK